MLISSLLSSGLTSNIADFFKLMGFKFSTDIKWKYIDKGQIMMERKSGQNILQIYIDIYNIFYSKF
jgi:hypothetical protein